MAEASKEPDKSTPEKKEDESMDVEETKIENLIGEPVAEIKEKVDMLVAKGKSTGDVLQWIEDILYIEKKQRQAEHEANTLYAARSLLTMLYDAKNWKVLAEQISVICKRRSQFKRVVTRLVQLAMEWLDELSSDKPSLSILLEALLGVTEGKIYVEVERARLTMRKSKLKEAEGDLAAAAKILGELQIETYGSMVKKEKITFLLDQLRLTLANNDLIRCGLARNKITNKAIRSFPKQEITYWELSQRLFYAREKEYIEMAKGYRRLLDLYEKEEQQLECLANAIYTVALAEQAPDQVTLLNTLNQAAPSSHIGKLLERIPRLRQILRMFCTHELISFPKDETSLELSPFSALSNFRLLGIDDPDQIPKLNALIRRRALQHNLRVIAKYYVEIQTSRLSVLVGAPVDEMERELSAMVTSGALWARIDRVSSVVRFFKKESPQTVLNNWRRDINQLLGLVNTVCHQIHKDQMEAKA